MKMNIAHINLFRKIDSNSLLYLWGSWWCLPFSSINQEVHRIRLTPRDWGKTCSLVDLHPAIDTHFLCVAREKQIPHHNQNNINQTPPILIYKSEEGLHNIRWTSWEWVKKCSLHATLLSSLLWCTHSCKWTKKTHQSKSESPLVPHVFG